MAIISEYEEEEEDSEERPAVVGVINMQDEEEDGYEDEDEDNDEDYNPDPYFSSQPVYATNSMRPFDEVLRYLLQEHQQQPLDLLSTVIEYLFRKTGIAMQEGVDARVSEMLFAAKRMRVDGDDIEDVFAGPDKVAKLDEIFDDPGTKEEDSPHVSVSESTKGLQGSVSSTSESSKKQGSAVEDEETVIITPTEYLQKDMCEDPEVAVFVANNSGLYHQTDTNHDTKTDMKSETEITTLSEVEPVTNNWLAGEPGNIEIHCKGKKKGLEKGEKPQDLDPNSGNGADLGHYSWTQTLTDTALIFPVPAGTKAKSVVCEIQPRYLKIGLKGEIPLLEGDLNKPVKPSECFWNLEDGKLLTIHLQKWYTMDWWHVVVEGEPEIDVEKLQLPQASLSDLHPDTRQHIEHTLFEQKQAAMGVTDSGEERKADALRKFMGEGLELYA